MQYSVVIPAHNEDESLEVLFDELTRALGSLGGDYELIFVDDGSTDRSLSILTELHQNDPGHVVVIDFRSRQGQTFAMRQGLAAAKGSIVMTLDADLQNDPQDIPKLVEKMQASHLDCVCGWRKSRQDTLLKAGLSKFGNVLQRVLTGLTIHDVSCTLRAYRLECVKNIPLNWEGQHRFIPLSLSLQGYRVGEIISYHRQRRFGKTKYSHKRIFRVIIDFFRILFSKGK